jgi:hypothetical protein
MLRFAVRALSLMMDVALLSGVALADDQVVYENRFDDPPGKTYAEWSSSAITSRSRATGAAETLAAPAVQNTESPNKKERFLGQFGGPHVDATAKTNVEQTVTLALDDLPPHKSLTVAFDLYVMRSWDGDSPAYGPDRWTLQVNGGPTLLDTTFSNNPKTAADGSWQSYPKKRTAPQTGAAKRNTLGCDFFGDSTYHFTHTFDHTGKSLKLDFAGSLFEGKGTGDEAWGIDNVRVTASATAAKKAAKNKLVLPSRARGKIPETAPNDDSFTPLLEGNNLGKFERVGLLPDDVTVQDGEIRLSGQTKGYLAVKESYGNYVLRFDWMFEKPAGWRAGEPFHGNSGLLVHISGPDKVWPRAIEVQIWYKHEYGDFYTFDGARFDPRRDDHASLARVLKPVGEWNAHEVTCRDGTIALKINGQAVALGRGADPAAGRIGWMSEEGPVRFRRLQIKKLD